jgi:hypothetical protein
LHNRAVYIAEAEKAEIVGADDGVLGISFGVSGFEFLSYKLRASQMETFVRRNIPRIAEALGF